MPVSHGGALLGKLGASSPLLAETARRFLRRVGTPGPWRFRRVGSQRVVLRQDESWLMDGSLLEMAATSFGARLALREAALSVRGCAGAGWTLFMVV